MDRRFTLIKEVQTAGVLAHGEIPFLAMHFLNSIAIGPMIDAMLRGRPMIRAQNSHFERAWKLCLNGARE
jgi:hypothetical protein